MSQFSFAHLQASIKINIFKFMRSPLNLALCNRGWSNVARDPHARTEWLIVQFGKTYAFFHGIRLGSTFINKEVCQSLIARNVNFSRYLVQKLLMHYGKYDLNLIESKLQHNITEIKRVRLMQHKIRKPWASDLPQDVFIFLLNEGNLRFGMQGFTGGNDMELFCSLTSITQEGSFSTKVLQNNYQLIKELILEKKFIPFPPRPASLRLTFGPNPHNQIIVPDEYAPKDGYENDGKLKIIGRAIVIEPKLVKLWEKIGFEEICDLVCARNSM